MTRLALLYVLYVPGLKGRGLRAGVKLVASLVGVIVAYPLFPQGTGVAFVAGTIAAFTSLVVVTALVRDDLQKELRALVAENQLQASSCCRCGNDTPTPIFCTVCGCIKAYSVFVGWGVLADCLVIAWLLL